MAMSSTVSMANGNTLLPNGGVQQIVGRERRERDFQGKRKKVKGKRNRAAASTPPFGDYVLTKREMPHLRQIMIALVALPLAHRRIATDESNPERVLEPGYKALNNWRGC
jgi:hypothetical protein